MSIEMNDSNTSFSCPHYAIGPKGCGGCSLLHLSQRSAHTMKIDRLLHELADKQIIDVEIRQLFYVKPQSRRRVTFAAQKSNNTLKLGYFASGSNEIINVTSCLVAKPELTYILSKFREILTVLLKQNETLTIHMLLCDNGLDISIDGKSLKDASRITDIFNAFLPLDFARLTVAGSLQLNRVMPYLSFGNVKVTPPPVCFVQACDEAEKFMQTCVYDAVGKKPKLISELFCGIGTFTGKLLQNYKVHGYESNVEATSALTNALKSAKYIKPYKIISRDLYRRPLTCQELNIFDAIVINPPRAGAEAQIKLIAQSTVKNVVYVSCNTKTFARDAKKLCATGYKLYWIQPIDQFQWSEHLEVVAHFKKK